MTTITKEIWKEQQDDVMCRMCKKDRVTVAHIMCGCNVLLQMEYLRDRMECWELFIANYSKILGLK